MHQDYTLAAHRYNLPALGQQQQQQQRAIDAKLGGAAIDNSALPPAGVQSGTLHNADVQRTLQEAATSTLMEAEQRSVAAAAAAAASAAPAPPMPAPSSRAIENPFYKSEAARQFHPAVGAGPQEAPGRPHVVATPLLLARFRAMLGERGPKAYFTFYQLVRQQDRGDHFEKVLRALRMVVDPRELHTLHHLYDPDGRDVFQHERFFAELRASAGAFSPPVQRLCDALADAATIPEDGLVSMQALRANFQGGPAQHLQEFLDVTHNARPQLTRAEFADLLRALALGFPSERHFALFLEAGFPYLLARSQPASLAAAPPLLDARDWPVVFDASQVLESLPTTYYDRSLAAASSAGTYAQRGAQQMTTELRPLQQATLPAPHLAPHGTFQPYLPFQVPNAAPPQRSRCLSGPHCGVPLVLETLLEIFRAEAARDPERRVLVRFAFALKSRDAAGRGAKCQWEDLEWVLRNGRRFGCDAELTASIGIANFARVFAFFDDGNRQGFMDVNKFLIALRGPIKRTRLDVVDLAFAKMDALRTGSVGVDALEREVNVANDPRVLSGRKSEAAVIKEFVDYFRLSPVPGRVSLDEFRSYYANVSAVIEDDAFFRLMLWTEWNLATVRTSAHGRHAPMVVF